MTPPEKRPAYEVSFLVVYDIPSGNRVDLENPEHVHRVETVRSKATQLFHKLGVQTTESVILISPERENRVDETVELVKKWYGDLERQLHKEGLDIELEAIIEVLGLSSKQTEAYKKLAVNFIEKKAGDSGRYCERVFNGLEENRSAKSILKILKNLEKHRRSWAEIQKLCCEMKLSNDWNIPKILAGIDDVIEVARKRLTKAE